MAELDSPYLRVVLERILNAETNDARFEAFCNAVVSQLEGGARILSTSKSWDMGRDGVGVGLASDIYLCTSLRDDVDGKGIEDIERVTQTTQRIKRLYVCTCQTLSEHAKDRLRGTLEMLTEHAFPITPLAANDLSQLVSDNMELVERHYGAEKADIIRVVTAGPGETTELRGLRLAMMSTAADDSHSIRNEVYSNSLLDALADGVAKTPKAIGIALGSMFKLGNPVASSAIQPHLDALQRAGWVDFNGIGFSISPAGRQNIAARQASGAGRLLELRQAMRNALESALGESLVDDEFARVWAVLEERLAQYFHSRGEALVCEVATLLDDHAEARTTEPSATLVDDLAEAVGNTSSHADRKAELTLAVKDLFRDRTGPAAEWLVRISAHFLVACALGMEHATGAALQKLFSRTRLVLDTDVVLSLLGEGEPEHDAVGEIVSRWRRLGGKILVAEPVLEEAARHAWIATADFDFVAHLLPGTPEDRLHLVGNAFVRSFAELVARGALRMHQWRPYIGMFAGEHQYDFRNVYEVLASEHKIDRVPGRSLESASFEQEVQEYLARSAERQQEESRKPDPYAWDKARRDAILYVAIVDHLDKLREQDPASACLLVSSSKRLLAAEAHFRRTDDKQIVITIGGMLHMMSLLPDVQLGLTAMKAFLFDDKRNQFSSDLERVLLRMIRGTNELSLPLAKRGVLMRAIRRKIVKDANERGDNRGEGTIVRTYERDALKPGNERRTMQLLSDALSEIAVDPKLKKENAELKKAVAKLQDELQSARTFSKK